MLSRHSLTVLGANALFLSVSLALFLRPGLEALLYPAYGLIFLWADLRRDDEMHVIFLFVITAGAFLLMARATELAVRASLALETIGLWAVSFVLSSQRGGFERETRAHQAAASALEKRLQESERELRFYATHHGAASDQIRMRRDLTRAAKSLGSSMDPQEVQLRLLRVLAERYPGGRVHILPGVPNDPLVLWSERTRAPVLISDLHKDDRFASRRAELAFRSAVMVPLKILRKPYGFVRVESPQAQAYDADDLRAVDLCATLASLSLENIQLYQEVHELATHDSLTQLFTQRAFKQRLGEEVLRAGRSQTPLSLIMADVDFFKRYNDTYGHQAGDELLRSVARILVNHARPVDCVARYGGEEFALILPSMAHPQAVEVAERIRVAVASEPFVFQGQPTRVTMSLGVASFPQEATSQSQLLRSADERLYRSKHGGRNRVTG